MVIDNQLNPGKYSQQELDKNCNDAAYASDAYAYAAYAASDAYASYASNADVTYWLNRYFELTGENKQDYIDAINKEGNRQACPHKQ